MAGIYIHIPFCKSKCFYCDFYSLPTLNYQDRYADAVIREYEKYKHLITDKVYTIYIGGGTPSAISSANLRRIYTHIDDSAVSEATLEVNPEDVTLEHAKLWKNIGFNRISMGIQSLNDDELKSVGRRHSAAQAVNAYYTLREAGFQNLSVDLIYGLPLQTVESWTKSLRKIMDMQPEHLSAYSLSLEAGSRLYAMQLAGKYVPTDDNEVARMYEILEVITAENEMNHYEISNFALPGRESQHNSSYWNNTQYLGLGPGAHSFDGKRRYYNRHSIKDYLAGVPIRETEILSATDNYNDLIVTGLRTAKGLDLKNFPNHERAEILNNSRSWLTSGKLVLEADILHIPSRFWLISDAIIRDTLL